MKQHKSALTLNLPCSSILANENIHNKKFYLTENPVIGVLYINMKQNYVN
jgi:hypothetical protein